MSGFVTGEDYAAVALPKAVPIAVCARGSSEGRDHGSTQEVIDLSDEALNREQRRHPEKELTADPDARNNPVTGTGATESHAGRSDQDITRNTGAGAGGAT